MLRWRDVAYIIRYDVIGDCRAEIVMVDDVSLIVYLSDTAHASRFITATRMLAHR